MTDSTLWEKPTVEGSPSPLLGLARHVLHNLQYQHRWTDLTLHDVSPINGQPMPRPLLSGMPPRRIYVHPDEQVEMLIRAKLRSDSVEPNAQSASQTWEPTPEREWVLPTDLREEWTLRKFAQVFSSIGAIPPQLGSSEAGVSDANTTSKWRITKRLLLAAIQSDSTIVYYVIHDGIVKPRPN
jgi:tRNA-splicing endonuclease subunit Sen15